MKKSDNKAAWITAGAIVLGALITGGFYLLDSTDTTSQDVSSYNQKGGITAHNVTIYNVFHQDDTRKKIREDLLNQKYPLGYALFAADETTINAPSDLNFTNEFEMNWENARVTYMSPKELGIVLPDVTHKRTKAGYSGILFVVPRKAGFKTVLPVGFGGQKVTPIIEVLEDRRNFVVCVLGFR